MRIKFCAFNMLFHSVANLYQLMCRLSCATNLHVTVADEMDFYFCGAPLISGVV